MRHTTVAGLVLLGLLTLVATLGPSIAPYGVDEREPMRYTVDESGKRVPDLPPYPPSARHLFGTDPAGYDLLTRLLHGARYTLGFVIGVAAVRLTIALGIASALHLRAHARRRWQPEQPPHVSLGTAVPEFVVAYIAMVGIAFNPPTEPFAFALLQAALLTIIGLPGLVPTLRTRIERAASQRFVESQVSSGADEWHIYRQTVIPSIAHDLRLLLSHEALMVALIVGELALFDVFVGGTYQTFSPVENYSRTHEWVGMVGQNSDEILGGDLRLVLIPLAAYLVMIVSLALVSGAGRRGVDAR